MQLTDGEARLLDRIRERGSIYHDEVEGDELMHLRLLWVKGRLHWNGSAYQLKGESS